MISEQLAAALAAIGLTPAQRRHIDHLPAPPTAPFLRRVVEVQRDRLTLHDGEHESPARVLPALHLGAAAHDGLAVGDWVHVARDAHGQWWVHARVPPLNQLARRQHDGREKSTRAVIVSNVDTALLVMGLDHDFNLRRLERYLALARIAGVQPVVVLTKADLCDPAYAERRLHETCALMPPGVDVVALDATGDEPSAALAPWTGPGQTLVLLGSSGAGKSTLTNALTGDAQQRVGASRADDSRGRHTTTARSLHRMPGGACIIDTPGLRTLRLDADAQDLAGVFDEIAQGALRCRFRDCRHQGEPGCAVQDSVAPERLRNFHKMQRELQRDTLSALERKAQRQVWKVRHKAARARDRGKREGEG
ncbi:ribosome small subunit-dependent GTPase A [Rubrivivax albus]|uniref:Small ribosomal subunit biogenesis GTPase RsgA n=1 Tax=Rubrivivax albus TaxID=2499835 RepID=A0A437K0W3_9BURK|nr:ribosome small subunit-dependent GTPase A [Rubrivivax albus]RVT53942.1 ribosome small subunit-dependent GTPase A [Rubrivivax albus]